MIASAPSAPSVWSDRSRRLIPIALFAAALVQALSFWPGVMNWDAIRLYGEALSGAYDDWHPPAMAWLWRQTLVFGPGPGGMLVVQLVLYWSGYGLLADAAARAGRPRLAWAIAACALVPMPFVFMGAVVKDSLMAATLLAAAGLIVRRPVAPRLACGLALALLLGAATLRFNAVPACLPLAVVALPRAWRRTWPRLAATTITAAVPLALALPLANAALHALHTGVERSLIIYDLAGITRFTGEAMLPAAGVDDPVRVVSDCYTPVEWDRYAWWGAAPCAIGFDNAGPILARAPGGEWSVWARAVVRHPLAYGWHRLLHFNSEERFLEGRLNKRLLLETDPNPWGFHVAPSPLRRIVTKLARLSLHGPLAWPACWLALGLGLLPLAWRAGPPAALPLLLSALLYEFSYLLVGVASDLRYRCWAMMAIAIAAVLVLGTERIAGRARLLAIVPAALTAMVCLLARLLIA